MALVLIVDDDPMIVEMLADVVEEYGHTVTTATNGAKALALALEQAPALIISDVMMPVMDGYALLSAVRNATELKQTLIVLMSAASASVRSAPTESAPDAYLAKPFNLSVIEGFLDRLPPTETGG